MHVKKLISLGLVLTMLTACVGCGNTGASTAISAGDATGAAAETVQAEEAAVEGQEENSEVERAGAADAAADTLGSAGAAGEEIPASDISVKWDDSHIYNELTLGRYKTISTYEVKEYEDVPFIKATDYLDLITEERAAYKMDGGTMTVSVNGTEAVIDSIADTIQFANAARFREDGIVDGAIVTDPEMNVVTWSTKNKSTQTEIKPVTIALKDYHMPVIAYEGDILMPFLALQNTFGTVSASDSYGLAYNGKDYYNVYKAQNFALNQETQDVYSMPYMQAIYSGPFSELKETTQAYAEYGYYSICLLLDLAFGHKEEKNITTFDEYFTRMNAKKLMTSTDPSSAMTAELLLFDYLFDSGHDALMNMDNVFGVDNVASTENIGQVMDEVKESEEGQKLFDEAQEKADDAKALAESEDMLNAVLGIFLEKGLKVPELAPQLIWMAYFNARKPEDLGDRNLTYNGDTAVIYFNSFQDDMSRETSYYLDPIKEEDSDNSSFAFFYNCFQEIQEHEEVKNVVINLSDNGGGAATGLISILGFLSEDGEVKITDQDILTGSYREEYYHVDTNLDGVADDQDGFGGQYDFFIMTSGSSYSCGNALPYYAQKAGLAKIIGTNPGGGDCCVGSFVDAYGRCAGFSGSLKLGTMENGVFVSNEKAVTMDYDMMPSVIDVKLVPWFETEGIADAVHRCKNGEKTAVYSEEEEQRALSELMENLFQGLAAVSGIDLSAIEAGTTAEAAAVEGGN